MSEIVNIVGTDEATVEARFRLERAARPGMTPRVLRRDNFEACSLRVLTDSTVKGDDGEGFRDPDGEVYTMVIEFS